ncbi:unnamed protein product [Trichogramma brassicae]|uniref:Uncharacterized protein n=1 Tax=Trichogramma brassicae TaxID=86971 RepID=A0A6H5IHB0_9HYME|nr:unnamed protein product [Trichogramma brassicae]
MYEEFVYLAEQSNRPSRNIKSELIRRRSHEFVSYISELPRCIHAAARESSPRPAATSDVPVTTRRRTYNFFVWFVTIHITFILAQTTTEITLYNYCTPASMSVWKGAATSWSSTILSI